MSRPGGDVRIEIKRAVFLHSHGVCQYLGCTKQLVTPNLGTGGFTCTGDLAHILPVGDGPRAEFKSRFPHIDVNSPHNLMLLCPEHHRQVDVTDVDSHPPHILFRMKDDKSILMQDAIVGSVAADVGAQLGIDDYEREYEVSSLLKEFCEARGRGPKEGMALLRRAEKTMRSLLRNRFVPDARAGKALLETEYYFTKLQLSFKASNWREAAEHTTNALRLPLPDGLVHHLLVCALTLVRDEYGILETQQRLSLIAQLIRLIDTKVDVKGRPGPAGRLLLVKAGLLRWRGRFEAGPIQRSTFSEAQRCCDRSSELSGNVACLLQSALLNYATALSLPIREAPKHVAYFDKCFELVNSPMLEHFPAAIKYKPRIYRETYRFSESISAFWRVAELFPTEGMRVAFLLGEAAVGQYYRSNGESKGNVIDAYDYLRLAISNGYVHGRNVVAYISCRAHLEPEWFRSNILERLILSDKRIDWTNIMKEMSAALYAADNENSEPAFGIDEGEFWVGMGGITGRVLKEHVDAIRLLETAERHAQITSGRFSALLGLARQYKQVGDMSNFRRYLDKARGVGRAHQHVAIVEVEKSA